MVVAYILLLFNARSSYIVSDLRAVSRGRAIYIYLTNGIIYIPVALRIVVVGTEGLSCTAVVGLAASGLVVLGLTAAV